MTNSNEALKPIETTSATAILDVRDASKEGLALMQTRVENQTKMLKIAVSLTSPSQWTVFSGTGKDGVYKESIYPTGGAADTILRRAFGLTWAEKTITVEDTPDGRLATCSAWLMQGDQRIEHFTGYRLMGGFVKTEADLRRSVLENLKSVAVRDLLGLRFRSPAELRDFGLDVGKMKSRAEFQTHDADPGSFVVPFGRAKGQPISEVEDDSLEWLANAVKKSIADPEKARFKASNEKTLEACRHEYKRRRKTTDPTDAAAKPTTEPAKPDGDSASGVDPYAGIGHDPVKEGDPLADFKPGQ